MQAWAPWSQANQNQCSKLCSKQANHKAYSAQFQSCWSAYASEEPVLLMPFAGAVLEAESIDASALQVLLSAIAEAAFACSGVQQPSGSQLMCRWMLALHVRTAWLGRLACLSQVRLTQVKKVSAECF